MLRPTVTLALLTVAFAIPLQSGGLFDASVVQTAYGPVRGEVTSAYRAFRGIRFGNDTAATRFAPPSAPTPWSAVQDATKFAASCPQRCNLPPLTCPNVTSEDCLFLNVFTPTNVSSSEPLPVMAFIHGGRFEQGGAGAPIYEAGRMASQGVVVVTFNYRLNIFGFLRTDEFDGNAGFHDQIFALRWIQANVKAFGGDPSKVTLFGQSAGGASIAAFLASPYSSGSDALFHRAIVESNPWAIRLRGTEDAHKYGEEFAKAAGCSKRDNRDCLRSKTPDELLDSEKKVKPFPEPYPLNLVMRWTPVADGKTILQQPLEALEKQAVPDMPLMMGTTLDDGRLFIFELSNKTLPPDEFDIANVAIMGVGRAAKAISKYSPSGLTDTRPLMSQEATDFVFGCANRWAALRMVNVTQRKSPMYLYQWNKALSDGAVWGPSYPFCRGYACHASELPFVFQSADQYMNADEKALGAQVVQYWTSFAKSATADPNPVRPTPILAHLSSSCGCQ